jgi:hypothetical protein
VLREHNLKARKVSDDMAKVVELMLGNGKVCSDFNFGHSITAHYANSALSGRDRKNDFVRPTFRITAWVP